jgi:hypothetical protein
MHGRRLRLTLETVGLNAGFPSDGTRDTTSLRSLGAQPTLRTGDNEVRVQQAGSGSATCRTAKRRWICGSRIRTSEMRPSGARGGAEVGRAEIGTPRHATERNRRVGREAGRGSQSARISSDSAANGLADRPESANDGINDSAAKEETRPRDRTEQPVSRGAPLERGRRSAPPTAERGWISPTRICISEASDRLCALQAS